MRSIKHFGITRESRIHLCLSIDYIAGKMAVIRALEAGCTLTCEPPTSRPLQGDNGAEITLLSVVGAQVEGLLELQNRGELTPIRHLLVGGAPLSRATAEAALLVAGNVWESYGMTETASHIALRQIIRHEDVTDKPFALLEGISASLTADSKLKVQLPGFAELITNDIAEFTSPREFRILGRADNVIITGGLKVHPEQVEALLAPIAGPFGDYYLTSEPHPKWGNTLVLVIESAGLSPVRQQAILNAAAEILPPHQRPRRIEIKNKLPRTSSGKIIRKSL